MGPLTWPLSGTQQFILSVQAPKPRGVLGFGACTVWLLTQQWRFYLKRDISRLERVQRRATKLVALVKDLSYSDRLKHLGLPTLEHRRIHYDMIQVYKLTHGIDYINNMENLLQVEENSRTRGHIYKLVKPRCRTTNRRNQSFFYRVIDTWNSLPEYVITSQSTNEFKTNLNNHWGNHPKNFGEWM